MSPRTLRLAALRLATLAFAAPLLLAACSRGPGAGPEAASEVHDPAEPVNRAIFAGNQLVDRVILQPVARGWRDHVPRFIQRPVANFATNLRQPTVLVNDLLQANTTRAWTTAQRFVVNSTLGVAGLFDVATDWDLPGHDADFGQTFGVWGIGAGPAVQLPIFGPSNLRDTAGTALGFFANPMGLIRGETISAISTAGTGSRILTGRADALEATDALEASSVDYYAALRSAQAQRRERLVQEGVAGAVTPPATRGRAE